jgi:hypothetical protein
MSGEAQREPDRLAGADALRAGLAHTRLAVDRLPAQLAITSAWMANLERRPVVTLPHPGGGGLRAYLAANATIVFGGIVGGVLTFTLITRFGVWS